MTWQQNRMPSQHQQQYQGQQQGRGNQQQQGSGVPPPPSNFQMNMPPPPFAIYNNNNNLQTSAQPPFSSNFTQNHNAMYMQQGNMYQASNMSNQSAPHANQFGNYSNDMPTSFHQNQNGAHQQQQQQWSHQMQHSPTFSNGSQYVYPPQPSYNTYNYAQSMCQSNFTPSNQSNTLPNNPSSTTRLPPPPPGSLMPYSVQSQLASTAVNHMPAQGTSNEPTHSQFSYQQNQNTNGTYAINVNNAVNNNAASTANNAYSNRNQPHQRKQTTQKPNPAKDNKSNNRMDGSERDWRTSRDILKRLGQSLPASTTELEKWIEERKRNWPSQANVEKKKKDLEQRRKAGELLPDNSNKKHSKNKNRRDNRHRPQQAHANVTSSARNQANETTQQKQKIPLNKNADPLSILAEDYHSSCEEGEIGTQQQPGKNKENVKKQNDEATGVQNGRVGKKKQKRNNRKRNHNNTRRKRSNEPTQHHVGGVANRPQLLRKLLGQEIKREHSLLLQVFRHLLMNDVRPSAAQAETGGRHEQGSDDVVNQAECVVDRGGSSVIPSCMMADDLGDTVNRAECTVHRGDSSADQSCTVTESQANVETESSGQHEQGTDNVVNQAEYVVDRGGSNINPCSMVTEDLGDTVNGGKCTVDRGDSSADQSCMVTESQANVEETLPQPIHDETITNVNSDHDKYMF